MSRPTSVSSAANQQQGHLNFVLQVAKPSQSKGFSSAFFFADNFSSQIHQFEAHHCQQGNKGYLVPITFFRFAVNQDMKVHGRHNGRLTSVCDEPIAQTMRVLLHRGRSNFKSSGHRQRQLKHANCIKSRIVVFKLLRSTDVASLLSRRTDHRTETKLPRR